MAYTNITYDSAHSSNPFTGEIKELYRYRDLVSQLIQRNIKTRYKRSVFGVLWTMLTPILMTLLFSLIFSKFFHATLPNFSVYVMSGYICWLFFVQTSSSAMSEMIWGGTLLNKIYVPPSAFIATALGASLVYMGFSLMALLGLIVITGKGLSLALLFLPVSLLIAAAFSIGVGLILATLAVNFQDTLEMWGIFAQGLFFLTPIFYPATAIPGRLSLMRLNPVYYIVETFRFPFYHGMLAPKGIILIAAALAVIALLLGWWVFTRKAHRMPYLV
ncbi:MAG: ABC transporter permease [Acidobacteria bacterium]|nr:ABC transporter permease [Acidobacteriota bacterium]